MLARRIAQAIVVEGGKKNIDPALLEALGAAHRKGARIASLCTGAFVLAAAGTLADALVRSLLSN